MPDDQSPPGVEQIVRHLITAGVLTRPSDLDLVVFFARHPRSLLTSESLAAFLGYDLKAIADSLDALLAAGILRRRQSAAHAARFYELIVDGSSDWFGPLLALARTRNGRLALLKELARRSNRGPTRSHPVQERSRPGPRRIVAPRPDATNETKIG